MIEYLSIDLETKSGTDLSRSGVYRYTEDPAFEILLLAISKQVFGEAMEERERRSNYEVDENGKRKRRSRRFTSTGVCIPL